MSYSRRIGRLSTALVVLVTLISTTAQPSLAQGSKPILVDGSAIIAPILTADASAYATRNSAASVQVTVSGTDGGLEKFCKGQIDVAMANRAIRDAELNDCNTRNVKLVEVVLGYDALMIVVNPKSNVSCLKVDQLTRLLGPGAKGVTTWSTITADTSTPAPGETAPTPIADPLGKVYAAFDPAQPDKSPVRILADSVLGGTGLRDDLTPALSASRVVEAVKADLTAVGILTLADFQNTAGTAVRAVKLDGSLGCVDTSSMVNLSEQRYPASQVLYLYVNAESLARPDVLDYMNYVLGADGQANVITSGFVSADPGVYTTGGGYLQVKRTGRSFSRVQAVLIPNSTVGTINIDGTPVLADYFNSLKGNFSSLYKSITVNVAGYGDSAGFTKLCAGTADLIGTTRLFSDTETQACQKANIKTLQVPLGSDGVVLLVNAKNTWATCLDYATIGKLFLSVSQGKVKTWSDAKDSYPSKDLLLITPSDGSPMTDFLLNKAAPSPLSPTRRLDTSESDDVTYRATATGIYDNAITYMSFADYQKSKSAAVTPVAVDGGKGCVQPTLENLGNGTYPLSRRLFAIYNLNVLLRPDMRAFTWYALSDDAFKGLSTNGLVGSDSAQFAAARDAALTAFNQAPVVTQVSTASANGTAPAVTATSAAATSAPTAQA
ncbi:MAG TPA: substrate-binding domain-containing protein, partial [Aggregatilineales bacterium]|nr:substrate-binding domain-containing protein [Aggregatilineales bacterium]